MYLRKAKFKMSKDLVMTCLQECFQTENSKLRSKGTEL